LYYGFLPQFLSGMAELIWDGKYDVHGNKRAPVRIELPFQTVETVNESVQERQRTLELSSSGHDPEWRNRLIWGDKKYVLPSLLPEFAAKVDLIYIDPPFNAGADFSFRTTIPEIEDLLPRRHGLIQSFPSVLSSERCRKCYLQYLLDSGRRFRNARYSRSATVAREGAYQSRPRAIPRLREDFPGDSGSVTSHVCRRLRG